jgi:hypothetical protein
MPWKEHGDPEPEGRFDAGGNRKEHAHAQKEGERQVLDEGGLDEKA